VRDENKSVSYHIPTARYTTAHQISSSKLSSVQPGSFSSPLLKGFAGNSVLVFDKAIDLH